MTTKYTKPNPWEIVKGFFDGLKPEERLTVSEWSDKYRRLSSEASSEAGQWRTSRTPYLKEIMDKLTASDPCEEVILMKGAQLGGTEAGYNWVGYCMHIAPCSILMVMPTDETMKRNSKIRLAPMIEATDVLRDRVKPNRSRDSGNTLSQKDFPGGVLILAGANSAAGLRSMPIKYLLLDEVDAYPLDLSGEGSPIELAKARTRTFARRKVLQISTPVLEGQSVIATAYEETDQRKYFVPCPHCGYMQELKFDNLVWEQGKTEATAYGCDNCGVLIEERFKPRMLAAGEWRMTAPQNENRQRCGYHINSLYSPYGWYSWAAVAEAYEDAVKDPKKMKTFQNTVLGLPYKEPGESPPWEAIYNRRETYETNTVPKEVYLLTAGVDVQKDRLEVEIVGWGKGKESWSIDYRVLMGDTAKAEVWALLAKIVGETWQQAGGYVLPLARMAVDSGYNTSHVYAFCAKFDSTRVFPVKGQESQSIMLAPPKQVHVTANGKKTGKVALWNVGVGLIKSELYGWLRGENIEGNTPEGYCHFPQYRPEYFKGLTAEQLQMSKTRGYNKFVWMKVYERNEPLDCRVYARAAAAQVGIDRFEEQHWAVMLSQYSKVPTVAGTKQEPIKKRAKSSFW